jgi:hypothetical protein
LFSPEPLYIDDLENMLEEALYSLDTTTEDSIVEEVCLLATFFLPRFHEIMVVP